MESVLEPDFWRVHSILQATIGSHSCYMSATSTIRASGASTFPACAREAGGARRSGVGHGTGPIDNALVAALPLGARGNLTIEATCRPFGRLTGFDDGKRNFLVSVQLVAPAALQRHDGSLSAFGD